MLRQIIAFAALPLLASCVAPREAAVPMPAPAPAPRPAPVPLTAPQTVDRYQGDWSVADLDNTDWMYQRSELGSFAVLAPSPPDNRQFARFACRGGSLTIARVGTAAGNSPTLNIRTSFGELSFPIELISEPGAARAPPMIGTTLPASDPLWDQILYSRGRFVIEATRNAPMIVPTRPELARVVEDCRN